MPQPSFCLPKVFNQKLLKAIREFELIKPGDRVLVGFSGGKDSAFLLYALSIFKKHQLIPFELGAITIDLGFEREFNTNRMLQYCETLQIPYHIERTEIAKYALSETNPEGPCSICAFLRRGTMNRIAREHQYNVIALAHHHDDAVETFLMSIIYSGQIKTFLPRTELDRTGLVAIRPLVYFRESELQTAIELTGFQPVASPCPMNGKTKRATVKALIRELSQQTNPNIFANLASAIRTGRPIELWPPEIH